MTFGYWPKPPLRVIFCTEDLFISNTTHSDSSEQNKLVINMAHSLQAAYPLEPAREGKFIVIEGPDGAGSSTQVRLLERYLTEKGKRVLVTKEPTNNFIGGLIRGILTGIIDFKSPCGRQLLYVADRLHHLEHEMEPALEKGFWILTDRYVPSTLVYGTADGADWDYLMHANQPCRVPDLTLLIDVPMEICLDRIDKTRLSRELFEKKKTLEAVVKNYARFAREYPNTYLVNGQGSEKLVHGRIRKLVKEKFCF